RLVRRRRRKRVRSGIARSSSSGLGPFPADQLTTRLGHAARGSGHSNPRLLSVTVGMGTGGVWHRQSAEERGGVCPSQRWPLFCVLLIGMTTKRKKPSAEKGGGESESDRRSETTGASNKRPHTHPHARQRPSDHERRWWRRPVSLHGP